MQYRYQKPHRSLSKYVKTVLIAEGFAPSVNNNLPLFTNGMPALICGTATTPTGIENILQLNLFGKSTPPEIWDLKKNETVISYFFNPFLLACLFNLSASELAKKSPIDLSKVNPQKTNALRTQLSYAKTTEDKIEALDSLLLHQLNQQQRECEIISYSTDQIMVKSGKEILADVLDKLKLNERTFQRIFKKFVGVTPSQYRRICQFKQSFDQVRNGRFDKLTDVAFNTGFADQSHFIRSFKEFTQVTPKDYKKSGLKRK